MFRFIRHRRDGLVRIVLALALATTGYFLQPIEEEHIAEGAAPKVFLTQSAAYGKCNQKSKATTVGKFGCAVILKPTLPTSSIKFLSASAEK